MATAGLLGTAALALAAVCLGSGCSSLGYYAQAAGGHIDLLQRARPVAAVLADSSTPVPLRERLQLSQRLRDFAVKELKLPDNGSYRRYADLQRPAVVWNVVAAPELSLTLKTWCFPVMGCVGYRGYYDRAQADALARELKGQVIRLQRIDKRDEMIRITAGWGSNVKGSWRKDRYSAEVVFMDRLLAVIPFEVADDFEEAKLFQFSEIIQNLG